MWVSPNPIGYIGLLSLSLRTASRSKRRASPSHHWQSCMPLHVAYIESQAACLQCSMYFCHHVTFSLCNSPSLVLQMLHSVKAVGFGDHEITVTKRCLATQSNQRRGTERHQLSLIAGHESALRDLGYSMNASRRPKPPGKRRNASPMIEGSIGEHGQAGGHTFTIYNRHRVTIQVCERNQAINRCACGAGYINLAGRANGCEALGARQVCRAGKAVTPRPRDDRQ
jgi:hypothetical protein